jgi:hypothetical protein
MNRNRLYFLIVVFQVLIPLSAQEPWLKAECQDFRVMLTPVAGTQWQIDDLTQEYVIEVKDRKSGATIYSDDRVCGGLYYFYLNGAKCNIKQIESDHSVYLVFALSAPLVWRDYLYIIQTKKTAKGFVLICANTPWIYYGQLVLKKARYTFCSGWHSPDEGPFTVVGTLSMLGDKQCPQSDIPLLDSKGRPISRYKGDDEQDPLYQAYQASVREALEMILTKQR